MAKLEALITLSFGHLPRFQFAGMKMTSPLDGGLGTVKWNQNFRPCQPQSSPKVPNYSLRKDEPTAHAVRMGVYEGCGLYGGGSLPPHPASNTPE